MGSILLLGESGYLLSFRRNLVNLELRNESWIMLVGEGHLIVGIGFDLQDIADFARSLSRGCDAYVQRLFTAYEATYWLI